VTSNHPPQPDGADLADPILTFALQHAVYCLSQAALIHIERVWAENRLTDA
jgi:CRISPR-associated exonuclease Cas4